MQFVTVICWSLANFNQCQKETTLSDSVYAKVRSILCKVLVSECWRRSDIRPYVATFRNSPKDRIVPTAKLSPAVPITHSIGALWVVRLFRVFVFSSFVRCPCNLWQAVATLIFIIIAVDWFLLKTVGLKCGTVTVRVLCVIYFGDASLSNRRGSLVTVIVL